MGSPASNAADGGGFQNLEFEEDGTYHAGILGSGKRYLETSSSDGSASEAIQSGSSLPPSMATRPRKRLKLGSRPQTQSGPEYLLIHKVECGHSINHNHHPKTSFFLDPPRLFAGDNKTSPLRGTVSISNVAEHLEDNEHISIIIYRTYYCEDYHATAEDDFERLRLSDYGVRTVSAMRPYLFVLSKDTPEAECASEEMTLLSQDLREALNNLEILDPKINCHLLRQDHWTMNSPYLQMYHFRDLIRQTSPMLTGVDEQKHVDVLLRYIDEAFGDDYAEADNLFSMGLVSQKHASKLFGPEEIVVTMKEGQPVAYVSKGFPSQTRSLLTLHCESWKFDGVFGRKVEIFDVMWPTASSSEVMPIIELNLFPLKYDRSGIKKRLLARGQVLWNCRKRRYMSYTLPTDKSDTQTVRIQISIQRGGRRELIFIGVSKIHD
jgi:hypothetical protein